MSIQAWKLALLLALMPTLAFAEHAIQPDPANPASPVLPLKYESGFADYRSFQDQKPASWKDVNTEVAGMSETASHTGHASTAQIAPPLAPVAVADAAVAPAKPVAPKMESPSATGIIAATGVVQQVDKANAKVKLSHDPIAALGWPKMTMFFRLKDGALADQVKAGDAVEFLLEKTDSGYVISNFRKSAPDTTTTPSTKK